MRDVLVLNLANGNHVMHLDALGGLHDESASPGSLIGRVTVFDIGADGIADLIGPTFEDRCSSSTPPRTTRASSRSRIS